MRRGDDRRDLLLNDKMTVTVMTGTVAGTEADAIVDLEEEVLETK